jgi:dihydroorotase
MNPKSLEIIRPDDWHVHLRDHDLLPDTLAASGLHFGRILAMPNLQPPLVNLTQLMNYRQRIMTVLPATLQVFHTLYLNHELLPETLIQAQQHDFILGAKLYPAGATTHSDAGVLDFKALYPMFDLMQSLDLVLQIHGEEVAVDIFDREKIFIEQHLRPLIQAFPRLRVVLEHISTRAAVEFVLQAPDTVAATITPQHLLFNRNDMLHQGIKPHLYCLPILKRREDQHALIAAATQGHPQFFAGTDSAPHVIERKESSCGCAGCFSAPFALMMYAEVFEKAEQLSHLEAFMSKYGADFYRLPHREEKIVLSREACKIPLSMRLGPSQVVPLAAGQTLQWSVHAH